jgi:predicted NBD/HSP70 family sugar kinase
MKDSEVQSNIEIKKNNCIKTYNYIYTYRRTSKQTIAQALSLSMPTVNQNLKILENLNLITKEGFYESTGGRKASIICCTPDAKTAIGIVILKETVSLCLVNLYGEIMEKTHYTQTFQNTDTYYQKIGTTLESFLKELPVDKKNILGVGIAIQGLVSSTGDEVIYGTLLQNTGSSIQKFQQFIPYPCHLIHDTEASAFAEFWHNEEIQNAIYLVLNHNLGGALIINGKIHQGSGIIEHMTLFPEGKQCYCGKKGCLEAYCSANSLRQDSGLPLELFFQQLRSGNEKCKILWDTYLENLALAMDNMRMLVNCKFVIGGYLQQFMNDEDFSTLTKYVSEKTAFSMIPVSFAQSRHGNQAAMLGAAIYYIESFLNHVDSVI